MKKSLSVFLAILIVVGMIPLSCFTSFANEAKNTVTGTCGDNITWSLDIDSGILTLDGTGCTYDYTSNTIPWKSYKSSVKKVVLSEGITGLGKYLFYNHYFTDLSLPSTLETIGDYAFYEGDFISLTLPEKVHTIGRRAFAKCFIIETIDLGKVENIGDYAFESCGFTSITIPDSTKKISEGAFIRTGLVNVDLGNGVEEIGTDAFSYCHDLEGIKIPASVTKIHGNPLVESNFGTELAVDENNKNYVVVDGILFSKDMTELISYPTYPDWPVYFVPETVVKISDKAFADTRVETVYLPDGVREIGVYAFSNGPYLEEILIPLSVEKIGDFAFYGDIYLSDIYYAGSESDWYDIDLGSYNSIIEDVEGIPLYPLLRFNTVLTHYHEYNETSRREPDCTNTGRIDYECSCGKTYFKITDTQHTPEVVDYKEPDCTQPGHTGVTQCAKCGEILDEGEVIPAKGHTPGSWQVIVQPTNSSDGMEVVKCKVCKETLNTAKIPAKMPGATMLDLFIDFLRSLFDFSKWFR